MGSEQEMIRTNAGANVARMADDSSVRNRAVKQFVNEAMCANEASVDSKLAIRLAAPEPAGVGIRDVATANLSRVQTITAHYHTILMGAV